MYDSLLLLVMMQLNGSPDWHAGLPPCIIGLGLIILHLVSCHAAVILISTLCLMDLLAQLEMTSCQIGYNTHCTSNNLAELYTLCIQNKYHTTL